MVKNRPAGEGVREFFLLITKIYKLISFSLGIQIRLIKLSLKKYRRISARYFLTDYYNNATI